MLRKFVIFFVLVNFLSLNSAQAKLSDYELSVKTFDNFEFDLQKQQDKVVIVLFWAWWCPNCTKEMAILDDLYGRYHHRGLEIIGISVDKKKDLYKAIERSSLLSFHNALKIDGQVSGFGSILRIPKTFLFDRKGELYGTNIYRKSDWERVIKELI